eukprot:TRINITY_DN998_c1_g3_i2.p1 TRINITY_DN998_c1_g3~~TRINITY_DN998_c1_g3_i2.p1  ORF type:complete len:127 (+),score=2.33 TRINITY_DN998_c1_g3_i2:1-381(+)
MYRLFKTSSEREPYIAMDINRYIKSSFTRFRFGVSDIACHCFRYHGRGENDFVCRLCNTAREDELHFLLCCPVLCDLRAEFIQPKYYKDPCGFRLTLLLSNKHLPTLRNLAKYIYLALKRLRMAIS